MYEQAHVTRDEIDGTVVLSAVGDFDLACVDTLRTAFGGALADSPKIVLDLSETTFADSTALGVMVAAAKQAAHQGGWVRLVAPLPNVRKLLRVTAIDTVLGLYDSTEDAVTHVVRTAADKVSSSS
jgi:anti-anti-sigma factor